MQKKPEVICARVTAELAERIRVNASNLNDRPQGFVVRTALERFYQAVDAGLLPPICDDTRN